MGCSVVSYKWKGVLDVRWKVETRRSRISEGGGGERTIDEVARIYSWPITFYWCTADRGDFVCATKWLRGICHRSFMTHRAEPVCRSLRRTRRSRRMPSLFLAPDHRKRFTWIVASSRSALCVFGLLFYVRLPPPPPFLVSDCVTKSFQ